LDCAIKKFALTFGFQQSSKTQFVFGHGEGILQVLNRTGLVKLVILDEVGAGSRQKYMLTYILQTATAT
jgi:hypothetical protein